MTDDDTAAPFLTTEQAGRLLGVSARTVRRMVAAGLLRVAQRLPGPNGPMLFLRLEVEAARRRRDQERAAS